MGFFAVLKVKWKEPEAFRQEQDLLVAKELATLLPMRPYAALFFAIFCLAARTLNKHLRGEPFDLVAGMGISLGSTWVLFYGLWRLIRRLPATVNLYSNGIMKMGEKSIRLFKEIAGYNWSEEGSYYVLNLITKKRRTLSYGVPDPMTCDKIEAVLNQAGLKKMSMPTKPDFASRRKAIWGNRIFTTSEVEAMRDEENRG